MKHCFIKLLLLLVIQSKVFVGELDQLLKNFDQRSFSEVLFEKDKKLLDKIKTNNKNFISSVERIPKVIYFIWLGPNRYPDLSLTNLTSWKNNHQNWDFILLTDRTREEVPDFLSQKIVTQADFNFLYDKYLESTNYAQKSDLLRYEILYRHGGVYIDHDVVSFNSIEPLISKAEFVCGLEPDHKPVGESAVTVCNNIIASVPHHPILKKTINRINSDWVSSISYFNSNSPSDKIKRVFFSTFLPFSDSVFEALSTVTSGVMVCPPYFFNAINNSNALFANHQYAGTWYQEETDFEYKTRIKLDKISKNINHLLKIISIIITLFISFLVFRIINIIIKFYQNQY